MTSPVHTVTNLWEPNRDVLASKENKIISTNTIVSRYDFAVNSIDQRTAVQTSGTAFANLPALGRERLVSHGVHAGILQEKPQLVDLGL